MPLTRRKMLALIGGGTVLAASGAATAFLTTRTPERALAPWAAAGTYSDPRMNALSWALTAPNAHNTQPWLAELKGADQIVIWRDKTRLLPETDPFDRQLTISMGAFLEGLAIGASASGYSVDYDLFPEGEDGPVAVAQLTEGAETDPLFAHLLNRRSCKEPFEDRVLEAEKLREVASIAQVVTDSAEVAWLRDLTFDAWVIEAETPRTYIESVDYMRFGKAEIEANPDGIDMGGPLFESLILLGQMNREKLLDTSSTAYRQGFTIYEQMLRATPAYAVITTPANTREDQITAGRQWMRLNLTTTALGLALHPVSQVLQEYPEMSELYADAHNRLAKPGETVQMLGRLGYGPQTPVTPRWPLETRLLNA